MSHSMMSHYRRDELGRLYIPESAFYGLPSPPTTPPTTPPKYTREISPGIPSPFPHHHHQQSPTYIIQHVPPEPPKPWYSHRSVFFVAAAALSTFIFTVHRLEPIINSSAGALHNVGQFVGSAANVGNAFGNSVHQTNRFGAGIAGAVGDVWCSVVGGSRCPKYDSLYEDEKVWMSGRRKDEPVSLGQNALVEGSRVVAILEQLRLIPHNVSASTDILTISEYLNLINGNTHTRQSARQWANKLQASAPSYHRIGTARDVAYSSTHTVLQGIVDQYNTALLISQLPLTGLNPVNSRSRRRSLLSEELIRLVQYTTSNHDQAHASLREARRIAETLSVEGREIVSQARGRLSETIEQRRMHPLWEGVCKLGWCDVQELDRNIALLKGVIGTMDVHTAAAIRTERVTRQLMDDLKIFVNAFNATAGVSLDTKSGNIVVGPPGNPWLPLQRLGPGMAALSTRLHDMSASS